MKNFISQLQIINFKNILKSTILWYVVFSFCILFIRLYITHSFMYLFLVWNLFLAFIPYILSLILRNQAPKNKFIFLLFIFLWFIFFPNALYIITDLIHLKSYSLMPIWFDAILVFSFSWLGMIFGFLSLYNIETILNRNKIKNKNMILSLSLFLAAFGIYLGRFQRWNSWDIFQNPHIIFLQIADRFIHPIQHPRTWAMTLSFGLLFNFIYFSLKKLNFSENNIVVNQ